MDPPEQLEPVAQPVADVPSDEGEGRKAKDGEQDESPPAAPTSVEPVVLAPVVTPWYTGKKARLSLGGTSGATPEVRRLCADTLMNTQLSRVGYDTRERAALPRGAVVDLGEL